MKNYTLRKNKHYTSIIINRITKDNLIALHDLSKSMKDITVVKPSLKAIQTYVDEYKVNVLLCDTPANHYFSVMGEPILVVCRYNDNRIKLKHNDEVFITTVNDSLIENIYHYVTGGLLYF